LRPSETVERKTVERETVERLIAAARCSSDSHTISRLTHDQRMRPQSQFSRMFEGGPGSLRLFEIRPLPSGLLGLIVVPAVAVPKCRTSPQGASPSRPVIPTRSSNEQSIASRRHDPRLGALKTLHPRERLRRPRLPNVRNEGACTKQCGDRDDSIFVPHGHCHLSFA
jgi:hypothetical protein